MIYFITGPVNSGKSTRLLQIYKEKTNCDGIYNIRRYVKGEYIGQDIVMMSTGEYVPFSRIIQHLPNNWDELYNYKNYSFSTKAIEYVEKLIIELINKRKIIGLDEIGPLELMDKGLASCFKMILENKCDAYVVCRESCIKEVITKFNISEHCMII